MTTLTAGPDVALQTDPPVILPPDVHSRLLAAIESRLPIKSFGYLISSGDPHQVEDFLIFEGNIRNSEQWKGRFEAYGQYFLEHDDAGFVATPEESWQMQKQLWARGMVAIGVFHSHLRHPANFSLIDHDLHTTGFRDLWHLIVSVRTPNHVQVRAFSTHDGVRELPVLTESSLPATPSPDRSDIRLALALDPSGRPAHPDSREIHLAVEALLETRDRDFIDEVLIHGFLAGSAERYDRHVRPLMQSIAGGLFTMGTPADARAHYAGESPAHAVELAPFSIASVPVTRALFGLFQPHTLDCSPENLTKPAVDLTWFDAQVFALWMGCRLPTEAEWEFACAAGSPAQWACPDEDALQQYAWYSRNAHGQLHPAGALRPNQFGVHDMHGNTWEWCSDGYDQDFYAHSPTLNPHGVESPAAHKVCRGGSFHALSEMCRTRYRFHEPADFTAWDLGFRLAKTVQEL